MNKLDELLKLKELLELEIITKNDFNKKKEELFIDSNIRNKNSDTILNVEIIIGKNEKECPTCKFIIEKECEICKFCDYDFINKNFSENNDDKTDKIKIEKYFLILILIIIIIFAGILIIGSIFPSNNSEIKNNTSPEKVVQESKPIKISTDSKDIISEANTSKLMERADGNASASEQITNDNNNDENSNLNHIEEFDYTKLNNSYFYGIWEDENSSIFFNKNGTCILTMDNYKVNYFWKFENKYLYMGSNESSLTKHVINNISQNSFSYKAENENSIYHAKRIVYTTSQKE